MNWETRDRYQVLDEWESLVQSVLDIIRRNEEDAAKVWEKRLADATSRLDMPEITDRVETGLSLRQANKVENRAALTLGEALAVAARSALETNEVAQGMYLANWAVEVHLFPARSRNLNVGGPARAAIADALKVYLRSAFDMPGLPMPSIADCKSLVDQQLLQRRGVVWPAIDQRRLYDAIIEAFDEEIRSLRNRGQEADCKNLIVANLGSSRALVYSDRSGLVVADWEGQLDEETRGLVSEEGLTKAGLYLPDSIVLGDDATARFREAILRGDPEAASKALETAEKDFVGAFTQRVLDAFRLRQPPPFEDTDVAANNAIQAGLLRATRGNVDGAIESFKEAYGRNATNYRVRDWLGYLYLERNPLIARQHLQSVPPGMSSFADWNLAWFHWQREETSEAIECLRPRFETDQAYVGVARTAAAMILGASRDRSEHGNLLLLILDKLLDDECPYIGLLQAFRHGRIDLAESFLVRISLLAEVGPVKLPTAGEIKDRQGGRERIFALRDAFLERQLQIPGSYWVSDVLRKQPPDRWAWWRILGDLRASMGDYPGAGGAYVREFESTALQPSIPEFNKINRLFELLRFLRDHDLSDFGRSALEIAGSHGVSIPDDLSREDTGLIRWASRDVDEAPQVEVEPPVDREPDHAPQVEVEPPVDREPDHAPERGPNDRNAVADALVALAQIKTAENLADGEADLAPLLQLMEGLGPAEHDLAKRIREMTSKCRDFVGTTEANEQSQLSGEIVRLFSALDRDLRTRDLAPEIQRIADPLRTGLRRAQANAAYASGTRPEVRAAFLNEFLSSGSAATSLVVEVEDLTGLEPRTLVRVNSASGNGIFLEQAEREVHWHGRRCTLRFPLRLEDPKPTETFQLAGYALLGETKFPLLGEGATELAVRAFSKVLSGRQEIPIAEIYVTGGMVPYERPDNFKGREGLLRTIRSAIPERGPCRPIFLNGIRAVGKSSILEFIRGEPPEGIQPIYVNGDRHLDFSDDSALLYSLAETLQRAFPGGARAERERFDQDPRTAFGRYLEDLTAGADLRPFLLFDEFQSLIKAVAAGNVTTGVLDTLRALLDSGELLAAFTASVLLEELKALLPEGYRNLWRNIHTHDVGFLNEPTVRAVVERPAEKNGIRFADDAIHAIWRHARGHPWLVQTLAARALDILNREERLVVCSEDIDDAGELIVNSDHQIDEFWWVRGRFEPSLDERILESILDGQDAEGQGIARSELLQRLGDDERAGALQRLASLGASQIIERDPDTDVISVKALLLERWVVSKRVMDGRLPFGDVPTDFAEGLAELAVYMDAENYLFKQTHDNAQVERELAAIMRYLRQVGKPTRPFVQANGDWTHNAEMKKWRATFKNYGFEPVSSAWPRNRDAADMDLNHQVRDFLRLGYGPERLAIISGDHSLIASARDALEQNKEVWQISWKSARHKDWGILAQDYVGRIHLIDLDAILSPAEPYPGRATLK